MELPTQRPCPNCGFPTDMGRPPNENQGNSLRCRACEYEWRWKGGDPWPGQPVLANWEQFGIEPSALRGVLLTRLAKDLRQVEIFAPLLNLSPENGRLDVPPTLKNRPARDLGFGGARIEISTPAGNYLDLRAYIYMFQNEVAALRVQCYMRGGNSPAVEILNRIYDGHIGSKAGVLVNYQNDVVLSQWQQAVEAELGAAPMSEVPPEFAEHYDLLTTLFGRLDVGTLCGIIGHKPIGCVAMLELVKHRQVNVLRKILRCCRPEGRIYAAGGLLRLQAAGVDMMDADEAAIEKLRHSPVFVESCGGCIISSIDSPSALYELSMLLVTT